MIYFCLFISILALVFSLGSWMVVFAAAQRVKALALRQEQTDRAVRDLIAYVGRLHTTRVLLRPEDASARTIN